MISDAQPCHQRVKCLHLSSVSSCRLQIAEKAGIPPGVLNVVTSSLENTPAAGKVLCEHPLVAKISFTGSTAVGKVGAFLIVTVFITPKFTTCKH